MTTFSKLSPIVPCMLTIVLLDCHGCRPLRRTRPVSSVRSMAKMAVGLILSSHFNKVQLCETMLYCQQPKGIRSNLIRCVARR